jgi:hypothetical protein
MMTHQELVDYIKSAYYYEKGSDDQLLMTDYEWDMLGKELQDNWDTFDSPLKDYVEKESLGITALGIRFAQIIEDGLIEF